MFTVTEMSIGLFALLEGGLCHLGAIIILVHSFLAQYIEPLYVYIFSLPVEIPLWQSHSTMTGSLVYDINSVCLFHC
jgi:hypothetical protein